MKKFFWTYWIVIALQLISFASGYTLTDADHKFLLPVKNKIDQLSQAQDKERMISIVSLLESVAKNHEEDSRAYVVLWFLKAYVMRQFDIAVSGEGNLAHYRGVESDLLAVAGGESSAEASSDDEGNDTDTDEPTVDGEVVTDHTIIAEVTESEEDFFNTYRPEVTSSDTDLPEQCFTYFHEIDAIAQEMDFPTALIIAMRYREHTCYFDNPNNGRGNFQITSHYYEPGDITREEFDFQVRNFIDFSRAKRARYDNLLLRDDESIDMTYDSYDLNSIRKHSILYNGIKAGTTPETNKYANNNFGDWPDGKDGIVAAFLKVVKWKVENN